MKKQNPMIGSWITLGHPAIAEILADAGFDWLCVDLEHSVIDYAQAQTLISAIQGKGIPAYVRVGENNPLIIKKVTDAGADGIIVPMVNSAEEAHRAVQSVKYPPAGRRGVGLARAQKFGFGFDQYLARVNQDIPIIVQIEHIDAIENLSSILDVEGVSGTLIGPYDLSGSMGKPGKFDDPGVIDALSRYEKVSKEKNKSMGFHVIQPDHRLVAEKLAKGYTFIAFSLDTLYLGTLARQELAQLRKGL